MPFATCSSVTVARQRLWLPLWEDDALPMRTVEFRRDRSISVRSPKASEVDAFVGARIRERRKELKITLRSLGTSIGVSGEQMSNYERGEQRLAAAHLYEIAIILELTISDFFRGIAARDGRPEVVVEKEDVDAPGQSSEVEVIAKLGRLARIIQDPVLRGSVKEILKGLPVFKPSADRGTDALEQPNLDFEARRIAKDDA